MMRARCCAAAAGLALALFFLGLTGAVMLRQRGAAVGAQAAQAVRLEEKEPEEQRWLIRTVGDEVCVFRQGVPVLRTGVSASLLPKQDREALRQGITVGSQAELTSLLEDLGS